ncbi:MAG: hypothetical protein J0I06_28190, partial [Planctomycetes bacterium]|nr:hypothetical protein [Planctomycetota bacterium]
MSFREDESRTVSGHAAANLAMLRRMALSLLRGYPERNRLNYAASLRRRSQLLIATHPLITSSLGGERRRNMIAIDAKI